MFRAFGAGKEPTRPHLRAAITISGPETKNMGATTTGKVSRPRIALKFSLEFKASLVTQTMVEAPDEVLYLKGFEAIRRLSHLLQAT